MSGYWTCAEVIGREQDVLGHETCSICMIYHTGFWRNRINRRFCMNRHTKILHSVANAGFLYDISYKVSKNAMKRRFLYDKSYNWERVSRDRGECGRHTDEWSGTATRVNSDG